MKIVICLHIPKTFGIGGRTTLCFWMHTGSLTLGRQKYIQLSHYSSSFEVEIATARLKKYKSSRIDQILAELIQA
jgi:hypothetical protein